MFCKHFLLCRFPKYSDIVLLCWLCCCNWTFAALLRSRHAVNSFCRYGTELLSADPFSSPSQDSTAGSWDWLPRWLPGGLYLESLRHCCRVTYDSEQTHLVYLFFFSSEQIEKHFSIKGLQNRHDTNYREQSILLCNNWLMFNKSIEI